MNEILDIEIILNKTKYHKIYNIGTILISIIVIFVYVTTIYNYQTYYITKGKFLDGKLELIVNLDDIKYLTNQKEVIINDKHYNYKITNISNEIYLDDKYNNYKHLYLKVNNLNNIDNYVYDLKIKKENKKIIEYLKDYL